MKSYRPHEKTQYWIVIGFKTTRNRVPFRHKTFGEACKEAERLAVLHPGQTFNVFKLKISYVAKKEEPVVAQPELVEKESCSL